MEVRRVAGYQLLEQGVPASEVARRQGVSPAAVSQWRKQARRRGVAALQSKGPTGPKPRLKSVQRAGLERARTTGAAAGTGTIAAASPIDRVYGPE